MTTWASAQSLAVNSRGAVTNGTVIYYTDQNGHIYEYEPGVGVSTIYTGDAGETPMLQMFQGYLYAAIASDSHTKIKILKYVSESWGEVWSDTGWSDVDPVAFMGDDDALVLAYSDFNSGTFVITPDMAWSADGANWSQSITWDAGGMSINDYSLKSPASGYITAATQEDPAVFAQFGTKTGSETYIYKFNSGQWQRQSATDWGMIRLLAINQDVWWRDNGGTYEYSSSNWGSWSAPANNYKPVQGINIANSFAYNYAGGGFYLSIYVWNTGTNAWDLDADVIFGNGALYQVIRLNSNDVFGLMNDLASGGTSREFYQRDPDISGVDYSRGIIPTLYAEFWQGVNGVGAAKKSDLPFGSIHSPRCMAIRDSGDVFFGAAVAGAGGELVVKGTSADDYATWEDLTGSLTDPIKALETL